MQINLSLQIADFILPAFNDQSKITHIRAGRRTGKTYNAVIWLIQQLLIPNPPDYWNGIWVDTRQVNIDKYIERYFMPILRPVWHLCSWNGQKKILKLPNGVPVDFGSSQEPENLEGFAYARGVLNEGGIILKKAGLWDNTLEPMFKNEYSKVKIIGTPKGKGKFFELGQQYKSYHYSIFDSPFWKADEIEKVKAQVPAHIWQQEYMAEYLDDGGTIFRNISSCIREPEPDTPVDIIGIDLGKHEDFTVIVCANTEKKQIVEIDRFNKIDWTFQKARIINMVEKYGRPKIVIDSTGLGDPIYDDLVKLNMNVEGYKITSASKTLLIENLSVALDNKEIFFPKNLDLIGELEAFSYEESPSGNIRYSAPDGLHDDCVIALALVNLYIRTNIPLSFSWVA